VTDTNDNRAFCCGPFAGQFVLAGLQMTAERPPECLQRLDPFARLLQFYLKQVAHLPAGCHTTTSQERSGLIKREAHLLSLLNEPEALYRLIGK